MDEPFLDFFGCPESVVKPALAQVLADSLHTLNVAPMRQQPPSTLPQLTDWLRFEQYVGQSNGKPRGVVRDAYYFLRPILGISCRKHLQKLYFRDWNQIPFPRWPVDTTVEEVFEKLMVSLLKSLDTESIPFIWFWPEGAAGCLTITHDVETQRGVEFCPALMDIDDAWGIKASYQIVPEKRYRVTEPFLESIRRRGFEVNVQDLNHDGHLFRDRKTFERRVEAINRYAVAYGARGFRAGAMYRNAGWLSALNISYDLSIPNVAHLEPQRGGCCTVFPYFNGRILEIPLTTTQDYSLFHILNDYSMDLWKRQIRLILRRHGLVSFIVHPDYVMASRARSVYCALLDHLAPLINAGRLWMALPGEIDDWWRTRNEMQIVSDGSGWAIKGRGSERARIAFACLKDGRLTYSRSRDAIVTCPA